MNYTKLGNFEAICLIVILFINHIVLNLPQIILDNSGSASILNCIYIFILILIFTIIFTKLLKKFTGLDIIDISEYLGGKFLKVLIGLVCIIYLITETAFLTRMFSKNLLLLYFNNYPLAFFLFVFLFIGILANFIGRKSIIKSNTIITPLALISIAITFVFVVDQFRFEHSLPFLANGSDKIFFYGASNIFAFNGLFFLFFISPLLNKKEETSKVAFISVLICGILLILAIATLVFAFSDIYYISRLSPLYFIIVNSKLNGFLERPELIFIFIWALALMSFISIALMFCINIFRKLTNIEEKNSKPLAIMFSCFIFVIALVIDNVFDLEMVANTFYKYGSLILIFGVFTIILIAANIKKRKYKNIDSNNKIQAKEMEDKIK